MFANLETSDANNQSSKIKSKNSINFFKINALEIKFEKLEQQIKHLINESTENQKKFKLKKTCL